MTDFTPSGEVGEYIDDNQFGSGQSVDKCGPEAVSIFWHSTKPGEANPYHASDVHAMASADYQRFIGPDNPADHNGTSDQTLYNMLAYHEFHYRALSLDKNAIKAWLESGYPVIVGIQEDSVYDLGIGHMPYSWNPNGLTHVINLTGPGANASEILVRDTANIAPNGVRPGPRHYDWNRLQLVSATLVVPSWLPVPGTVPPGAPPPPPPSNYQVKQAQAFWNATTAGAIPAGGNSPVFAGLFPEGHAPYYTTGIAQSWQAEYHAGRNWGPPVSYEFSVVDSEQVTDLNGNPITVQFFLGGRCEWNGSPHWYSWQ